VNEAKFDNIAAEMPCRMDDWPARDAVEPFKSKEKKNETSATCVCNAQRRRGDAMRGPIVSDACSLGLSAQVRNLAVIRFSLFSSV
jgi:hypothetical protein